MTDLLDALGIDPDGEDVRETPRRVADAYAELLTPEPFDATTFPNDGGYDEMVVLRGVRQPAASTTTSALRGRVREDARTRQEFLDLIAGAAPRRGA